MSHGAHAIAHLDPETANQGLVVFVENTCPGDVVDAEIYDQRKDFAFAAVQNLIQESPDREAKPKCPLHKVCGGCQWQHIEYSKQLEYKRKNVVDLFSKFKIVSHASKKHGKELSSKEEWNSFIAPVVGMNGAGEEPWLYRNKIIYPVRTVEDTGRLKAGYYKRGTHELINIKYCPIQYAVFDKIMERCKELCEEYQVHSSFLRHIAMRCNEEQTELLLTFIIRSKLAIKKKIIRKDVEALEAKILALFKVLQKEFQIIKGFSVNYNDLSTNVIWGEETKNLLGEEAIVDKLSGVNYRLSPSSFFQINNTQFAKIINLVNGFTDSECDLSDGDSILDAYCGAGTLSLSLAKYLQESDSKYNDVKIHGIEINPNAVSDAKANCELNGFDSSRITFEQGSMENFAKELNAQDDDQAKEEEYKLLLVNPPRKGCTNKVLDSFGKVNAKNIIYVSCNPATLSRDIKYLEQYGYYLNKYQAVDLFPHTFHVESVALLSKL